VNFADRPPSKQWAALKYRGDKFSEVWFKPEGEPFGLTFRIPQENFQIPSMGKQLTLENLLKAVAIGPEEVESWRLGDIAHSSLNGSNPDFKKPLPLPLQDIPHLEIYVRLKPQPEAVAPDESGEPEIPLAMWHELEARWKAILGLEAALETVRISVEGLLGELENSLKKNLTMEEKTYALRSDVAQWERAKIRGQFALPKIKDFIHRSIWAMGSPERKRLEEIYKDHIQPQIPFPRMEEVLKQLEELRKDRQILAALGKAVSQDSRGIAGDVQAAMRTLQNNAVANAKKKKASSRAQGKFFKD
jgi:hypothetical protein